MTPQSQHENEIKQRLRALPEDLQYASKERLVQKLAAIQVKSKGFTVNKSHLIGTNAKKEYLKKFKLYKVNP